MKRKFLITLLSLVGLLCISFGVAACDGTTTPNDSALTHTHEYVQKYDDTEHWLQCDVSGCTEKFKDRAAHDTNAPDRSCSVCGYKANGMENPPVPTHNHNWLSTWENNDTHHWHKCTAVGCTVTDNAQKDGYGTHDYNVATHRCVCGKRDPSVPTEGLAYTLNEDKNSYSVTGIGTATDTEIIIPSEYQGKPITKIGDDAFLDCDSLTGISIPNSVTSIGHDAFGGCYNLQYNEYDNVLYLGNDTNKYLVLKSAQSKSFKSYTVHENTKFIYQYAFSYCEELTNIMIPNGVTSIGDGAFSYCSSLTSISIPDSITSIVSAFFGCYSLQYNEYDNALYLGNDTNKYVVLIKAMNTSITSCSIHANTKVIYQYAFLGSNLTSITIPESVKSIGESAFSGCDGLTSITIPDGVTSIGDNAFFNCNDLTSIAIPNGVTSIGYSAFESCDSLTSISIPDSVTNIGTDAFRFCHALQYTEYDNALYLGNDANRFVALIIAKDTSITSCAIPGDIKIIYEEAFHDCGMLISINFNGTQDQWNTIAKGNNWNTNTGNYTVKCTNGKLDKNGNVIIN